MPCWTLFAKQSQSYRDEVLPPEVTARMSIEAAATFGWSRWVGVVSACRLAPPISQRRSGSHPRPSPNSHKIRSLSPLARSHAGARRDGTTWLGREDSNLRMAESKSDYSARNINAHFEKTAEYGLNSINRLALPSKCSPLSCCLESSTRSKLAYQSPTHRSASITSGLFRQAQTMMPVAFGRDDKRVEVLIPLRRRTALKYSSRTEGIHTCPNGAGIIRSAKATPAPGQ
jgi:transketolase-like protein